MAKRHPLQNILTPLLFPLSLLYGAGGKLRRCLAGGGFLRSWRPPVPCVSIGNISWGGTGKTPVTDWLLSRTEKYGLRAAVLTRGYGAHPSCLPLPAVPGITPAEECGDEPLMLASRHPLASVVVDPDRSRAGKSLVGTACPDLFLLDDGFQHIRVQRDLDLVLLDQDDVRVVPAPGRQPSNWNRVIPAGTWREPESALNHAGAYLLKTEPEDWPELVPALKKRLATCPRPVFAFQLEPDGLCPVRPQMKNGPLYPPFPESAGMADARDVPGPYLFVCGIGNPSQALRTVTDYMGRPPEHTLTYPDHHDFKKEKETLERPALPIICTGKDAVKLAPLELTVPCFALEVNARFFASISAEELAGKGAAPSPEFSSWWDEWLRLHVRLPR